MDHSAKHKNWNNETIEENIKKILLHGLGTVM